MAMAEEENRLRRRRRRTSIHDIPDDTLLIILLRIPSPVVLVRAAATCKQWRRVIGDAGFLRDFRRLTRPYMLGHHLYYSSRGVGRVQGFVPFLAPTVEIGVGNIRDRVSLGFLASSGPTTTPVLHDSRGGLLALSYPNSMITVCSPWAKKSQSFFCPTALCTTIPNPTTVIIGAFLLDTDPEETAMGKGLDMSNFRTLCVQLRNGCRLHEVQVQAFVYSESRCVSNRLLQLGTMDLFLRPTMTVQRPPLLLVGRAGGSICWCTKKHGDVILHLDETSGEFSLFTMPERDGFQRYNRSNLRVVGGDAGAVRLVRIVAGSYLEVLQYARGIGECVLESVIFPSLYLDNIDDEIDRQYLLNFSEDTAEAAVPGCIVLCDKDCDVEYVWMFSVDRQKIILERVQKLNKHDGGRAFLYELPWTISACL